MKKICFITGTRADYGLIKPLIDEAKSRPELQIQLIATGAHLSKIHGETIGEIEEKIDFKIEMLEPGDDATAAIKSMGRELIGLAEALSHLKPDCMIIPGDRYEMLAAASACLIARVPIIHIYGGDVTEGAFDDSIRHAITKMASLHFVSNEDSRRRVIQMGEQPDNVINSGSPSLDKIASLKTLSREELAENLNIKFRKHNIIATFHPETLSEQGVDLQVKEFASAIKALDDDYSIIITMPNADPEGQKIRTALEVLAKGKDNIYLFESLGFLRYFSMLKNVDMVIGNSSSGLYEAPSFKIPTVNIGTRQDGRIMSASVINVPCRKDEILKAIKQAETLDCSAAINPYGKGDSAKIIIDRLVKSTPSTRKKFYDIHNS